jgi:hypothetical protein
MFFKIQLIIIIILQTLINVLPKYMYAITK